MVAENQWFVTRLIKLPVVKAISDKTISTYETVKHANRLFNVSFQLAENSVRYASETSVAKLVLENRATLLANHIAVSTLDKVEHSYPVVKKTPEQLWNIGQNYYNQSWVKPKVDTIVAIKDYGVTKIDNTKSYCQSVVSTVLDGVLDMSDALVDKYVIGHGDSNGQAPSCAADATYPERVRCITLKLCHGTKQRAGQVYDGSKAITMQILSHIPLALTSLELAQNVALWANDRVRTTLTSVQQRVNSVRHGIHERIAAIFHWSEGTALSVVQGTSTTISALTQQVAKYSGPYLPENAEKAVAATANYITHLNDAFSKANTLGDVNIAVVSEVKQGFHFAQSVFDKGAGYVTTIAPISWLVPARFKSMNGSDGTVVANGFVDGQKKRH